PLENRRSHSSNPHRSQRRNRAPSGPRFRALALLGRLSWERVDAFVMQASEKPAQDRKFTLPQKQTLSNTPSTGLTGPLEHGHLRFFTTFVVRKFETSKRRNWNQHTTLGISAHQRPFLCLERE